MKTVEQLEKENRELNSKIFNIAKAWRLASSDISSLFEVQPINKSDGSYGIDGQSCHDLYSAIVKAPAHHLDNIKADTIEELIKNIFFSLRDPSPQYEAGFEEALDQLDVQVSDYVKQLRGGNNV